MPSSFDDIRDLEIELNNLIAELTRLSEEIARELFKPVGVDSARVTIALSKIIKINHQFLQFIPKIPATRKARNEHTSDEPQDVNSQWNRLNAEIYQTRTWLNQWNNIEALVRQQIPPEKRKLYRRSSHTEDTTLSQLSAYDEVFLEFQRILNTYDQSEKANEYGCFADISTPNSVFIEHVHAAFRLNLAQRRRGPTRFIDVGCGGGTKVVTASKFFDYAVGLEYDPGYAAAARQLVEQPNFHNCSVIEGDALEYSDYNSFDVIFFYRPMRHVEMLRKLEDRIVRLARPGAILIAPYQQFTNRYEELGCARVAERLYLAKTKQSDADALRVEAEMTGTFYKRNLPLVPGAWNPIIEASLAKGFGFEV